MTADHGLTHVDETGAARMVDDRLAAAAARRPGDFRDLLECHLDRGPGGRGAPHRGRGSGV